MPTKQTYLIGGVEVGRYDLGLLDLCGMLHGVSCGTGGDWYPEEYTHRDFVRSRLNDWQPSTEYTLAYDEGVRALCCEALREFAAYVERIGGEKR